ncbi:hypothetical protein D3C72_1206650 [compost metagenome]
MTLSALMVFSGTKTAAMNRVALCITAAIFHARNAMQPNTPPNMGIQKMSDEQTYPAQRRWSTGVLHLKRGSSGSPLSGSAIGEERNALSEQQSRDKPEKPPFCLCSAVHSFGFLRGLTDWCSLSASRKVFHGGDSSGPWNSPIGR